MAAVDEIPAAGARPKRNDYLDYCKGALILLVVYGHVVAVFGYKSGPFLENPVLKLIYIFHMPLFMAVSGYVSFGSIQKTGLVPLVIKRFRNLIVPIISWSITTALVWDAITRSHQFNRLPIQAWTSGVDGLWFLWALFLCLVVVAGLKAAAADRWFGMIPVALAIVALPDAATLPLFKSTFPFFCLGYEVARHWKHDAGRIKPLADSRWLLAAMLVVSAVVYLLWTPYTFVYVSGMSYQWPMVRYVSLRLAGGVAVSYAFLRLTHPLYRLNVALVLIPLGRGSLYIYLMQGYVLFYARIIPFPWPPIWLMTIAIGPVVALAMTLVLYRIGILLERVPPLAKWYFGRVRESGRNAGHHPTYTG